MTNGLGGVGAPHDSMISLSRRQALQLFSAGGLWLATSCATRPAVRAQLPRREGDDGAEIYPSEPGILSPRENESLWRVFQSVGAHWDMQTLSHAEFTALVNLKTQRPPSYLAEYRSAVEILGPGDLEHALSKSWDTKQVDSPMEHAKSFVLSEFLRLHLASGGFSTFGFTNYPGYPAGPRVYRKLELEE